MPRGWVSRRAGPASRLQVRSRLSPSQSQKPAASRHPRTTSEFPSLPALLKLASRRQPPGPVRSRALVSGSLLGTAFLARRCCCCWWVVGHKPSSKGLPQTYRRSTVTREKKCRCSKVKSRPLEKERENSYPANSRGPALTADCLHSLLSFRIEGSVMSRWLFS